MSALIESVASEVADREISPPEYEIATYPADFTLEVLFSKWGGEDIEIPRFQRQFVWTQAQSSKLIESFLIGLPVPGVFLYTDRDSEKFLVIDGQQRLRTIFYFFEGFFGPEKSGRRPVFRLKGLSEDSPYRDKTFAELEAENEPAARRLKNSVLRAFVVKQLNPADDTSVYHIFERLNTGGTLLNNQEVRNCVYGGSFNDLLIELNDNPHWRQLLGKKAPDNRQRDVELILRFLALRHGLGDYAPPMNNFLSAFMAKHRRASASRLRTFRKEFEDTVDAVLNTLGPRPFHIWSGLNSSAYDSVFCAYARHKNTTPKDIKTRYKRFKNSEEFENLVRRATTDSSRVRQRMRLASTTLFD